MRPFCDCAWPPANTPRPPPALPVLPALPAQDFALLDPYSPVKPLDVLAAEIGVAIEDLVKLDANENLYGPLPQITAAVAACDVMHIYPDPNQSYLRRDIAAFLGGTVTEGMVCAGTGSDELLDLVLRLFDPTSIVNLPPTFGMYPFLSKICKSAVINVDRGAPPAFAVDGAAVAAGVAAGATVVFVASPNNPTGGMLTHAEVRALCALPAIIVVDEAYAEFAAPGSSAADLVAALPHLIVMRTFSKWAGLAGLRVGYSVAAPSVNAALMSIKQPYNVNVSADVAARAALAHAPEVMRTQVAPMLVERDRIAASCAALGWLAPYPTDSNFVLFEVRPPFVAAEVVAGLRSRGVLVRYYPSGRLAGCLRISAGRPRDTDRLMAALRDVGDQQLAAHGPPLRAPLRAALWDMDGVLVDVAGSYRAAIVATAAAYGVAVSADAIDAAKAAGGANNDWALSLRLIAEGGAAVVPSLGDVTATFERLYQGDAAAGVPGLKATETPLVTTADLLALKARLPGGMAVVTGRPRADAEEAIARYGWAGVFDALVCMEDAQLKPHPAPVLLAVVRLQLAAGGGTGDANGVHASGGGGGGGAAAITTPPAAAAASGAAAATALTPAQCVMIGDTVDDIRSAMAAGAQAVGVYPPDKAPTVDAGRAGKLRAVLAGAGATDVLLPGCRALLTLVPALESTEALFAANLARVAALSAAAASTATSAAVAAASPPPAEGPGPAAGAGGGRLTIGTGVGRSGCCKRATKETSIYAWVNLDGCGESDVHTG